MQLAIYPTLRAKKLTAIMRQLGNAVPVTLAIAIAQHLQSSLKIANFEPINYVILNVVKNFVAP